MNQPNIFHNTTRETGKTLAIYTSIAKKQDIKVLRFFQENIGRSLTPFQVHEATKVEGQPLTSTRRSITNLTDEGYLVHTSTKKMGHLGRKTDTWKLKTKEDERNIFSDTE
jgi:hypothetical protein